MKHEEARLERLEDELEDAKRRAREMGRNNPIAAALRVGSVAGSITESIVEEEESDNETYEYVTMNTALSRARGSP